MKNLIRFCLLTTLVTASLNTFAISSNMFKVEKRLGRLLEVSINPQLASQAAYDLTFRFNTANPTGVVLGYSRAGVLNGEAFFNGEATVSPEWRSKRTRRRRSTAVLCEVTPNTCALLNSGSGSYLSNYTPIFLALSGAAQQGTMEICAGTTCENQAYTTNPQLVWSTPTTGTISAATQTSAATFTNQQNQIGFTFPKFITAPVSQQWQYVYDGGSNKHILKCGTNPSTALPENCSAQSVDLSTFSNIAGLRASPSGLDLFMVADSSVYRLAVDASTGDLTGAMVMLDTGVVDLGTVTATSNGYTPNTFFVTSSSPSRLCYCETLSEQSNSASCTELMPTSAALTEPTTISAFYYRARKGSYATYALAADGTTVKKFSVDLSAGTYSWDDIFVWDFGAVVTGISDPIAYQTETLEALAETDFVISLAAVGTETALGTLITLGVTSDRYFWMAYAATTPAIKRPVFGTQLL